MKLSATMEDYLETIYFLKQENGLVRVGEIAEKLSVKSPTVNSAISFLTDQGLVAHEKYGYVSLTTKGERTASEVKRKHDILFRFLSEFLMIDPEAAEKEACCIEHAISQETFLRLTKFFNFLEEGIGQDQMTFLESFKNYLNIAKGLQCGRIKE